MSFRNFYFVNVLSSTLGVEINANKNFHEFHESLFKKCKNFANFSICKSFYA